MHKQNASPLKSCTTCVRGLLFLELLFKNHRYLDTMALQSLKLLAMLLVLKYANAAPADKTAQSGLIDTQDKEKDLETAASNAYSDRYSSWGRSPSGYGGSYGVTGYGTLDNRYNNGGIGSYDNSYGYNTYDNGHTGYGGGGVGSGYGSLGTRYGGIGTGYGGVGTGYSSAGTGYGSVGTGYGSVGTGYGSVGTGYGSVGTGYRGAGTGYGGVGSSNRGGYSGGYGGNGGYGGYSGNGGLSSYYGYNNPNYQGSNQVGYGYYKRTGSGNIYNSGITPNLVTGYRGYSRK